jgi:hypothetical protein
MKALPIDAPPSLTRWNTVFAAVYPRPGRFVFRFQLFGRYVANLVI